MIVARFEIDGPLVYFRKVFIDGRSLLSYRRVNAARPLAFADRIGILRSLAATPGFGVMRAVALSAMLMLGQAVWACGRLVGKLSRGDG